MNRFQRRLIAQDLGLDVRHTRGVVMFWAGAHDIGKLSSFQRCEPAAWSSVGYPVSAYSSECSVDGVAAVRFTPWTWKD
ncbi:HD domain-containing protein [Streptomyces sp. NPDC058985]|uniref:HD domain-containing protein n=1 Tax=Streptomyces sp. NPDC058985 TaxID=3346684 RepID=UPI00369B3B7B